MRNFAPAHQPRYTRSPHLAPLSFLRARRRRSQHSLADIQPKPGVTLRTICCGSLGTHEERTSVIHRSATAANGADTPALADCTDVAYGPSRGRRRGDGGGWEGEAGEGVQGEESLSAAGAAAAGRRGGGGGDTRTINTFLS